MIHEDENWKHFLWLIIVNENLQKKNRIFHKNEKEKFIRSSWEIKLQRERKNLVCFFFIAFDNVFYPLLDEQFVFSVPEYSIHHLYLLMLNAISSKDILFSKF